VALVGKGLTFDSGGYNLKVGGMIEMMKFDCGGAAAVLGAEARARRRRGLRLGMSALQAGKQPICGCTAGWRAAHPRMG